MPAERQHSSSALKIKTWLDLWNLVLILLGVAAVLLLRPFLS